MNKVNWLLETELFDENLDRLKQSIEKSGSVYKTFNYIAFGYEERESIVDFFPTNEPVVFYGSLNYAVRIRKHAKWIPGLYCDLPKFECLNYYSYLGGYLLNRDYVMMPYRELFRRMDELYDLFSTTYPDKLFIRPSSGFKTFDGTTVSSDNYFKFLRNLNIADNTLVVVSSCKDILEEWRLVIVDKTVISASQYKNEGMVKLQEGCPNEVADLAEEIAQVYSPEPAYTMDICRRRGGKLYLVELNSFSCSGLYVAPTDPIVEAVNKAALREWSEYNE